VGVEHDRPVALGYQQVGETHRGPVQLTRRGYYSAATAARVIGAVVRFLGYPLRRDRVSRCASRWVRIGHAAALLGVSIADLSDAGWPAVVTPAEALPGAFMPVARMVHVIHLA
jgi:hypothetical protein